MFDLEKLKSIYNFGRGLNLSDLQDLFKSAKSKSFTPSEYLIKEGAIQKEIFFIRKGLVRVFIVNEKGDEITIGIVWENRPLASIDIIIHNQPSRFYFQALEQTETFSMDYDVLQSIISKNSRLEQNRKFVLQKMLKEAHERVESFVLYSPEERYARYVQSKPDIVNRVPNKYLANVLGITPVSLSRIRKRMASKNK